MKQVELRPEQVEMVEQIISPLTPSRHVLVAPAGGGKTTTMVEAVRRLAELDSDFRGLLVSDSQVAGRNFLARAAAVAGLTERLLDKRRLRGATSYPDEQNWPSGLLAGITGRDLRDDWARRVLGQTMWSLIIIDEPTRAPWLDEWVETLNAERIVVLASTLPARGSEFAGWRVTRWPTDSLIALREIDRVPVVFERSEEEDALLALVREAIAVSSGHPEWGAIEIDHASASSWFALQAAALRISERLRPLRNSLAHRRTGSQQELTEDRRDNLTSLRLYLATLERIIDGVDQLDVDERFQAFFALVIDRLTPANRPFVVFTSESRTKDYLVDRLRFMQREVEPIEPGWIPRDSWPNRSIAHVVADDAIAGLDLGGFTVAVFYDSSHNSASSAQREAQLSPSEDLMIFVLDELQEANSSRRALPESGTHPQR